MKFESILQIILFGSSIGLGAVIFKKIPVLRSLPDKHFQDSEKKQELILRLKTGIKNRNPLKGLSYEMVLEKILTGISLISLKIGSRVSDYLQELRQDIKQRKLRESDHYWEEIKKSTKRNSKTK
ncbi:MAG: hypothetical protein ACKKMP_02830 [Candidatus Nealsonbacteria bacterium]